MQILSGQKLKVGVWLWEEREGRLDEECRGQGVKLSLGCCWTIIEEPSTCGVHVCHLSPPQLHVHMNSRLYIHM